MRWRTQHKKSVDINWKTSLKMEYKNFQNGFWKRDSNSKIDWDIMFMC
jgi:hypothetical protein